MGNTKEKDERRDWGPTFEECADAFRRGEKAPFATHRDVAIDAWALVSHEQRLEVIELRREVAELRDKLRRHLWPAAEDE